MTPEELLAQLNNLRDINSEYDSQEAKLKRILEIQKEISKDSNEYFRYIKKLKAHKSEIVKLESQISRSTKKIKELETELLIASRDRAIEIETILEEERLILNILNKQVEGEKTRAGLIAKALKDSKSYKIVLKGITKDINSITKNTKDAYYFLNKLGLSEGFKFQKAIKQSAMQMGILSNQADFFSKRITNIATNTVEFGFDIEEVSKLQSAYSDELGRSVILSQEAGEAMSAMAKVTGLGAEGAGQFAASMDVIGYSAKQTAGYVEEVMNDAHAMGLNSTKVIKNIQQNIKLLNRYNFKGGAKGLAKMAESTTKMGVSMDMAAGMAEKLFDIEGAVEMSAQLQVMGGEWSKLADPFKLMYMARNDMKGLTESIINATKSSAQFNSETGEFDISALELHRLRKIAEQTGLEFEQLTTSAKNAAKFSKIDSEIKFKTDDVTKNFIESTAMFDKKKGGYTISVNGDEKLINTLTDSDKKILENTAKQKEDMKERAKASRSFDEYFSNTVTMFKQLFVPVLESLTKDFGPKIDSLVKTMKTSGFIDKLKDFAVSAAKIVGAIGSFMVDHPLWTLAIAGLYEAGKWFANGIALRAGFNSLGGMGGGVGGGGIMGGFAKSGKLMGGGSLTGLGMGLGLGLLGTGINSLTDNYTDKGSTGNYLGNIAGSAAQGAGIGAMFGPWGMGIGAALGGGFGLIKSLMGYGGGKETTTNNSQNRVLNDGIVSFNQNDKFMKVNDSTMIAGTNVNGNKELASVLSSSIPELANKNALMNGTKKGTVEPGRPSSVDVNLSELKVNGTIELKLGNTTDKEVGNNLLKDPSFLRDISRMVNKAAKDATNGGKAS